MIAPEDVAQCLQGIIDEEYPPWAHAHKGSLAEQGSEALFDHLKGKWYPREDGTYSDERYKDVRLELPFPPYHFTASLFWQALILAARERGFVFWDPIPLFSNYPKSIEAVEKETEYRGFPMDVEFEAHRYELWVAFPHSHDKLELLGPPSVRA